MDWKSIKEWQIQLLITLALAIITLPFVLLDQSLPLLLRVIGNMLVLVTLFGGVSTLCSFWYPKKESD